MEFTFLHSADLHLGSPFTGLATTDEQLAAQLSNASRAALQALVDYAIEHKVAFLVIAGDVYDVDWKDTTIGHFFNREISRLHRDNIPVFLVKGNHDADSVITKSVPLPPNVSIFEHKTAHTFELPELRVALHGRSFATRSVTENLALSYPKPRPGWFNIGILHTSCDGRPGHENYAPCKVEDLVQRGYDYWALGHVHTFEVLHSNPHVLFAGNLQGRNIRETGEKGAVLVTVEDNTITALEHIAFDRVRWTAITLDVTDVETEEEVLSEIRGQLEVEIEKAEGLPIVYRVILQGCSPFHRSWHRDLAQLRDDVQATAAHCADSATMESLKLMTSEPADTSAAGESALSSIDLGAMTLPLLTTKEIQTEAAQALTILRGRFPAMPIPDSLFGSEALQELLTEARESLLSSALLDEEV